MLAELLDRGIEGLVLSAVSARDEARAETAMAGFARPVPVLSLSELGVCADIANIMSPGPIMVLPPSQRAVPDLPHDKSNVIIERFL